MKEIKFKLRKTEGIKLLHNSKQDVKTLSEALNVCINKINELVQEVNELKEQVI